MKFDLTELIAQARRLQEGGKRPKYPVDFKRKAVKASQDYSAMEMINVLGIGRSTLEKWRRLYGSKTQGPKAKSSVHYFRLALRYKHELRKNPKAWLPWNFLERYPEYKLEHKSRVGRRFSPDTTYIPIQPPM